MHNIWQHEDIAWHDRTLLPWCEKIRVMMYKKIRYERFKKMYISFPIYNHLLHTSVNNSTFVIVFEAAKDILYSRFLLPVLHSVLNVNCFRRCVIII